MARDGFKMVLLGPPGAGKGTQAAMLTKAYNLLHVSTGDMLRAAIKDGSDVGKEAQNYMNKGELVPDSIVTQAVIERLGKPDASGGVILDGYPRTRAQAESLDESLKNNNNALDVVLYFKTSDETAIQRLSGRRVCTECGKNYHVSNIPPQKEGICDTCQIDLIQRDDDQPETVKNRLVVYKNSTKDLISYYKEKSLLREVDGNLSAEELFSNIGALFNAEGLISDDSKE